MIAPREIQEHAARWRVAPAQIHKDHVISHVLAAIAESGFSCWFYGGTALNRTYIEGGRLSEDIDIMVEDVTVDIEAVLRRRLLRPLGETTWSIVSRRSRMYTYDVTTTDAAVRVQLVRSDRDDQRWGWVQHPIELRYECLAHDVGLIVPEVEGFVAMKLNAYTERWAPRDLMDLANLSRIEAITPEAIERYRHATGRGIVLADFEKIRKPTRTEWEAELAHQLADLDPPESAVTTVRNALAAALESM